MRYIQMYYFIISTHFTVLFASFAPLRRRNTFFSDLADFSIIFLQDFWGIFSKFEVNFDDLFDKNTGQH